MTLADLARQAAARLAHRSSTQSSEGGAEQNPSLDAEVLARHVLGWDRARWLADNRDAPSPDFVRRYEALVARRALGEPVAYITGTREFWGLDFEVTPAVLIPRPETELLVEEALAVIDRRRASVVADVGTGSGCVAIAIAHERPHVRVIATDISSEALAVARRNASRHSVEDRIDFRHASGLDGVGPVDLVVSNPPYIARADAPTLMKDVVDFEPHTALFAAGDGLDVIRMILASAAQRRPTPPMLFEFGGNEEALLQAACATGLPVVKVVKDLAGIPRIALVER